jgi:hypothetical protein
LLFDGSALSGLLHVLMLHAEAFDPDFHRIALPAI